MGVKDGTLVLSVDQAGSFELCPAKICEVGFDGAQVCFSQIGKMEGCTKGFCMAQACFSKMGGCEIGAHKNRAEKAALVQAGTHEKASSQIDIIQGHVFGKEEAEVCSWQVQLYPIVCVNSLPMGACEFQPEKALTFRALDDPPEFRDGGLEDVGH